MSQLHLLPCLDSEQMAASRRQVLNIPRDVAAALGWSAVAAAREGLYVTTAGQEVIWRDAVQAACAAKLSIDPDAILLSKERCAFTETRIQVTNETTLGASRRLVARDLRPLALNFANGIYPGGGFLGGARAQEQVRCRSSALYQTLVDDPMFEEHRRRPLPDSTDWAIFSPDVPVFRMDDGTALHHPWLLSFITCAAPYAPVISQPQAGDLLQQRILRVLAIARSYRHAALVLGAWGCGAFGNDPHRTARDFRQRWNTTFKERSPTSSLPSQIGRRRGHFLGLFVMCLLHMTRHNMRKLITILTAVVTHRKPWHVQEEPIASHPRSP